MCDGVWIGVGRGFEGRFHGVARHADELARDFELAIFGTQAFRLEAQGGARERSELAANGSADRTAEEGPESATLSL